MWALQKKQIPNQRAAGKNRKKKSMGTSREEWIRETGDGCSHENRKLKQKDLPLGDSVRASIHSVDVLATCFGSHSCASNKNARKININPFRCVVNMAVVLRPGGTQNKHLRLDDDDGEIQSKPRHPQETCCMWTQDARSDRGESNECC